MAHISGVGAGISCAILMSELWVGTLVVDQSKAQAWKDSLVKLSFAGLNCACCVYFIAFIHVSVLFFGCSELQNLRRLNLIIIFVFWECHSCISVTCVFAQDAAFVCLSQHVWEREIAQQMCVLKKQDSTSSFSALSSNRDASLWSKGGRSRTSWLAVPLPTAWAAEGFCRGPQVCMAASDPHG